MSSRRFSLAPPILLACALVFAACGTPRQTAVPPAPMSDSLARARGVLTTTGDEGGFPDTGPVIAGAREAATAIRAVLDAQVAAWNAGDVRGYMMGYAGSDTLVFISNGQRRTGWQATLYSYMRTYPDQASMGTLSFEDLDIDVLAPDVALVHGLFRLVRAEDNPVGLFSLVFRRDDTGTWRIVHDHTSSSP